MSEVELLKQHLENRQETEAKLLLDLLDGQSELFSSDVKTLVKSLAERGDFQLMVELFSPVLQKRSGEILERLRDLPIPLMLYVISNVLVEMSVAVERLGRHILPLTLRDVACSSQTQGRATFFFRRVRQGLYISSLNL
jgi:hypothetical protein